MGECVACAQPWDQYQNRRCAFCRVLILHCDACFEGLPIAYCSEHAYYSKKKALQEKVREWDLELDQSNKSKRKRLRKRMEHARGLIKEGTMCI